MFRQGDVMVIPVNDFDAATCEFSLVSGEECVLAEGEVTGHAHRIKKNAKLYTMEGLAERFLKVEKDTMLEHEEHGSIPLKKGFYKVLIQKEYSPQAIRDVAD